MQALRDRLRTLGPHGRSDSALPALRGGAPRAEALHLRAPGGIVRGHLFHRLWRLRLHSLLLRLSLPLTARRRFVLRRALVAACGVGPLSPLSPLLAGCSPGYVVRAAWEEARILARRKPIAEVIADRRTDPEVRGKLKLVLEAREYARRDLHLRPGRSYEHYTDIGRDTLALVLSASPPDRLIAKTWWFPLVGRVPYLGFFDARRALRQEERLKAQGFDTYLRPTVAFSTLGWLPDPLLSTALDDDSLGLAETVIHELTHNTLFVKSEAAFNESLANFVGLAGAAEFLCRRGAAESACREAQGRVHDAVLVSGVLDALRDSLVALYGRGLSDPSEVLRERALLLERMDGRFRAEVVPRLRSTAWARLDLTRFNNASFLARHLYYRRLGLFEEAYRQSRSIPEFLGALQEGVRATGDPWAALQRLAAPRGDAQRNAERATPLRGDPLQLFLDALLVLPDRGLCHASNALHGSHDHVALVAPAVAEPDKVAHGKPR